MMNLRSTTATSLPAAGLRLEYCSQNKLASQSSAWWREVLGVVGFAKLPAVGAQVPVAASMTPALGPEDVCEVWRVAGPTVQLSNGVSPHGRVRYRYCDELLFGSIAIDETAMTVEGGRPGGNPAARTADAEGSTTALLLAIETAYEDIFALLRRTRHPHLIRVWNYLPEITRESDGDERYRHFNAARRVAYHNSGHMLQGTAPAACVLGSPAGSPIVIYFLASRHAPTMIENPRQTSAYHYPEEYGRHRPIFSRACMLSETPGTNLFVSGTASIVGHQSIHPGDVAAQTRESLVNITALVAEANRLAGPWRYSLDELKFKVYVREPGDLAVIKGILAGAMPGASVMFLQADVCREDLLVEIEATGESC